MTERPSGDDLRRERGNRTLRFVAPGGKHDAPHPDRPRARPPRLAATVRPDSIEVDEALTGTGR